MDASPLPTQPAERGQRSTNSSYSLLPSNGEGPPRSGAKALFLGFGKSKSADFATSDAITVGPLTPIRGIETLMIEQNQRFMPVVENERIIGAITRTDLLRTLYEEFLRRRKIEETVTRERLTMGRNLSSWLKEKFPAEIFTFSNYLVRWLKHWVSRRILSAGP